VEFTENIAFTRTRTVKSSGGDYTLLNSWISGEVADLTTLLEVRQAELYAMQDTTAAQVGAGWTTSATYYIKIYTTGAGRNTTGIYDGSNYYRLEVTNGNGLDITTAAGHVWVDGLQIQITATSGTRIGLQARTAPATGSPVYKFSNNIVKGVLSGTSAGSTGIANGLTTNAATMQVWNNIAYDFSDTGDGRGFDLQNLNWTTSAYNNTSYGNRYGYIGSSGVTAINNISDSNTTADYFSTFNASSSNNQAKDGTAPGSSAQSGAVTFVNAASENFQPSSADTKARGNGATDPGSGLFSDDIRGTTRTVPWDIGAWIAQASGWGHLLGESRNRLVGS
jgi:hypothetical protein